MPVIAPGTLLWEHAAQKLLLQARALTPPMYFTDWQYAPNGAVNHALPEEYRADSSSDTADASKCHRFGPVADC